MDAGDKASKRTIHQPSIENMFAAPQKKSRAQPAHITTVREVTLADIHDMKSGNTDNFSLTACVLYAPSEPRWVEVSNKQSGGKEQVPIITILLTDNTGPITFELWRNHAFAINNAMKKSESLQQGSIFITVKFFRS